jgi:type II secretory pathway pseudopilin PulG
MRRGAFSLVEIIIAMSIALVISGILFFAFFSTQSNTEKGMETLNYIRKATVLLEQLKQDIRASLRKKDSVKASGQTVTIQRYLGDKIVTVNYKFDPAEHCVTRSGQAGTKKYGADGNKGNVVYFAVNPVPKMGGFYKIEVKFETYGQIATTPGAATTPDGKKKTNYEFQTLVNKRAPEDTDKDIQWKYAYEEE